MGRGDPHSMSEHHKAACNWFLGSRYIPLVATNTEHQILVTIWIFRDFPIFTKLEGGRAPRLLGRLWCSDMLWGSPWPMSYEKNIFSKKFFFFIDFFLFQNRDFLKNRDFFENFKKVEIFKKNHDFSKIHDFEIKKNRWRKNVFFWKNMFFIKYGSRRSP